MDFTYGPEQKGSADSRLALPAPTSGPQSRHEWGLLTAIRDFFEYKSITTLFADWRAMTPQERMEMRVLLMRAGYHIPDGISLISKEESEELRKANIEARRKQAEDDGPKHELQELYVEQQYDLAFVWPSTHVAPKELPPLTVDSGYRLGDVHPSMMASSPKDFPVCIIEK